MFPRKTPNIHTIGGRLKIARQAAGFSATTGAMRLHVSKFTLVAYEEGKRRIPIELIKRCAILYGTGYQWLLMRSNDNGPPMLHTVAYDVAPPGGELPAQASLRNAYEREKPQL